MRSRRRRRSTSSPRSSRGSSRSSTIPTRWTSRSAIRTSWLLPGFAAAIRAQIEPQSVDWFAYKTSEGEAQEAIAAGLRAELALPFEPEDIAMTQGAFGAISLAFALLADAGDEVVIPVPGWFCYEPMLHAANLVPVRAPLDPDGFDLDIDAIARRSPRARAS